MNKKGEIKMIKIYLLELTADWLNYCIDLVSRKLSAKVQLIFFICKTTDFYNLPEMNEEFNIIFFRKNSCSLQSVNKVSIIEKYAQLCITSNSHKQSIEIFFNKIVDAILDNKLIIKTNYYEIAIDKYLINYIEKTKNYCMIYSQNTEYKTYLPLHKIRSMLPSNFVQINQGIILNRSYIKSIKRNTVIGIDGKEFSLGKSFIGNI